MNDSLTLKHGTVEHKYLPRQIFGIAQRPGADASLPKEVDEIEAPLFLPVSFGGLPFTAMVEPPGNMTCSLSPGRHECLYFSQHICYCLILEKKVAEQRIMKSKPNTHTQGKKPLVRNTLCQY